MPNEVIISRIETLLDEVVSLGGASERTGIVSGLIVVDSAPSSAALANHIIVRDSRDGNFISVLKTPGHTYANNDLVSVLFIEGTEPIALAQSPGSSSGNVKVSEVWESDFGDAVIEIDAVGNVVFNEDAQDRDVRIESSTRTHALFLRGSDGSIGINEPAPAATVHINDDGTVLFLEGSTNVRFDMIDQSSTSGQRRFAFSVNSEQLIISQRQDAGGFTRTFMSFSAANQQLFTDPNIDIGLGRNTGIAAQVDIDQASATGAQPVLKLDQADVSEEFIRHVGAAANGVLTQSIVNNADVATATLVGWLKVFVEDVGNQITDQAYYQPIYTLA